ncbi:helix-turn-helix domain-containing protein [Intestinirhabdus alba]|uniref:Helix-turn-helix domain-containing protein n=1 Tax=Intestinirhabdus alba TaxID=2899544 RepID=A0A6L6IEH0_9ENTR|nr:helix-turn-helix domain-containing protein [Intestinirhabdus alba]MTH44999.1 helix-turn-helix domain-containing protein [Intestinirhabdus alba]
MQTAEAIPVFQLYGEQKGWPTPELLHCESIHQRSSLYQWHIRMHQHAELAQLLYLQRGQAEIEIEGQKRLVRDACIQIVPALCVHGFRFSPGAQGYVLSLALPLIHRLEAQFPQPLALLNAPRCVPAADSRLHISTLFSTLQKEYQADNEAREMMLFSLLSALLVWLRRQSPQSAPPKDATERRRSVMRLFARQIESHYREHLPLSEYARRVGLSVNYLNQLCREFYNCSALIMLHQRIMLEAKRSLQYTGMTIGQLSDYLGFSDVTYFSRFFKKHAQMSPTAFRETVKKVN